MEEDVVIANLDADKYKDLAEKWVLKLNLLHFAPHKKTPVLLYWFPFSSVSIITYILLRHMVNPDREIFVFNKSKVYIYSFYYK